ncbi:MAG: putative heme-binding domain-containing protein [Saprospiraceae bacterium]|jgi:putative heme-binding domain-containing protein
MYKNSFISLFFILIYTTFLVMSCQSDSSHTGSSYEKGADDNGITMDGITLPKGFEVERIYSPDVHEQGSWVSITKDDKGRFYTCDQYGNIYRVTLSQTEGKLNESNVEKLDLKIGQAQGLFWHKGDLFALVNSDEKRDVLIHSGFYKITDSTGDGEYDNVELLRSFDGRGEHGPHNIVLAPDGQSMYLVLGNHTDIPEDLGSTVPKVWDEDNLMPVIKDPSGHANDRTAPGGWVVETDFEGKEWTLVNVGLRNTYDIAFNPDGELFGFDSDMEYDMGMPWYRPIRLCHMTSGGDFGWRTGTGKFRAEYPDNLPGIGNMGQGSPTGLLEGKGLKFPKKYQDGLFLFDWSYGTMYFASLEPNGSSYTSEISEFLSGVPLPLTNGIAGDDGAMYFLTGGRRLESGMYRVTYVGEEAADVADLVENTKGKEDRQLRKRLEALHASGANNQIDFIVSNLDHEDRFIRYAARTAMEHQDYNLWKGEINKKSSVEKTVALSLSIARHGNDVERKQALKALLDIDFIKLSESQKIDLIRAIDLSILRMDGEIASQTGVRIKDKFLPNYLKGSDIINKEVCDLLSYFQVGEIVAPTIDRMLNDTITADLKSIYLSGDISQRSEQYGKDVEKMLANMPNQQNINYAKSLTVMNEGWTPELRENYFRWYNRALKKSGGKMYSNFIRTIQKRALSNLPLEEQDYYEALSGEAMNDLNVIKKDVKQPVGPGQNWSVEEVKAAYAKHNGSVNFENGRDYFTATLCASCHAIKGEGGNTGPELSQVGTRFSIADLTDAIINPSATISDRYQNTSWTLKNGDVVTGRVVEEDDDNLTVSTNAFSPDLTTKFRKNKIELEEVSPYSSMPPGLINRLNAQELSDLIGYMLAGGDAGSDIYQ